MSLPLHLCTSTSATVFLHFPATTLRKGQEICLDFCYEWPESEQCKSGNAFWSFEASVSEVTSISCWVKKKKKNMSLRLLFNAEGVTTKPDVKKIV